MSPAIRRTDTISLLGQRLRILLPTQPQAQWGHSFDPRSENIPHAVGQLSPFTTATEPVCLQPGLCNKRSHRHETREEPPHPDQSQHAANQPSQKKKKEKTKRKRFRKDLRELKKKRTRSPVDTVSPSCWEIVHSPHQGHRGGARRALQPGPPGMPASTGLAEVAAGGPCCPRLSTRVPRHKLWPQLLHSAGLAP